MADGGEGEEERAQRLVKQLEARVKMYKESRRSSPRCIEMKAIERWQAIQAPAIADPSRDCVGKHVSVPGSFWNDSSSVERMRNYDCVVLRSAFCEPCCYDHHGASS